ncbi:hypothetical protein THAR02_05755 [Trichoderma harzianum]|uniref:VWFA domain-containing protein n=1 Tax=Trichoderma harzianum TaxID=5544 RepID=A0A0G0AAT1_TRIHA|nr:hypothetical protein THAR02_05755 [Trichoderma harzianum]
MSKKPCPMPEGSSTESGESPAALVGCLLDVSGSMQKALEVDRPNEPATERLEAVLRAALKVAQVEKERCSNALIFIGIFGLKEKVVESDTDDVSPSVVDLCAVADALVGYSNEQSSGHDLLIARANREHLSHITRYIREKLTDSEARILDAHLQEHPADTQQFVDSIPAEASVQAMHTGSQTAGGLLGAAGGFSIGLSAGGPVIAAIVAAVTGLGGLHFGDGLATDIEDRAVEESEALSLARRICARWLNNFTNFRARPVDDVIRILEQLLQRSDASTETNRDAGNGASSELETLKRYMYGRTPMKQALRSSLDVFRSYPNVEQRLLLLVSDGLSTDGDPLEISSELDKEKVSIATMYLTSDRKIAHRQLYYQPIDSWNDGQRNLFHMATNFSCLEHPVPVLASTGWKVPSEGEARLYAVLSSSAALDEFCSLLVSARPGMADGLLDIIGRISQDAYINDEHVKTCRKPSNQGSSGTCYAHATAGAVHMSLLRIVGREDGYPSIEEIRKRILTDFPAQQGVRDMRSVLNRSVEWYRPLHYQEVDENGARQAVLHRRPVLATFCLSKPGWDEFSNHFHKSPTSDQDPVRTLTCAQMVPHRSGIPYGGHAVIMTGCSPKSLTFLNSWGRKWGNNGSFSVESYTALELDNTRMRFYDVYWLESELTSAEKQAYASKVDNDLRSFSAKYPGILELQLRCPACSSTTRLGDYEGTVRQLKCPHCNELFTPDVKSLIDTLSAGQ